MRRGPKRKPVRADPGRYDERVTTVVEREAGGYVALCPELDIASQGKTVTEARANLEEALTLFFETAPAEEIESRLRAEARDAPGRQPNEHRKGIA